jgi:hypothetical protein
MPDLSGYVQVKDRIRLFYERFPEGRLVTDRVEYWLEVEPPRIVVSALAYRAPDDPLPGRGWSWLILPGATNFTRGSELENTETSAWGRAIGSLGIGIDASVASDEEIKAKAGEEVRKYPGLVDGDPAEPADGSLIGTVTKGATFDTDMQLRQTPDGPFTGFSLRQGKQRLKVVATGPLADVLQPFLEGLADERVSVWGRVELVPWQKGGKDMPPYRRLQLDRIKTSEWTLPAPAEAVTPPLFPEEALA